MTMIRPWSVSFVEISFLKEMESSETRKLFISRERVHVDRQTGRLRESHPRDSLNHLYGGISSRFPLASYLALGDSESVLGLPQGSPLCTHVHLLDKMDFS